MLEMMIRVSKYGCGVLHPEEEEEERTTTMISPSPSTSPISPTITVINIRPSLPPSASPVYATTRAEIPSSFSSPLPSSTANMNDTTSDVPSSLTFDFPPSLSQSLSHNHDHLY